MPEQPHCALFEQVTAGERKGRCGAEEFTREKQGRSLVTQPVLERDERVAQGLQEVLDVADDRLVALNAFVTSLSADAQAARLACHLGSGRGSASWKVEALREQGVQQTEAMRPIGGPACHMSMVPSGRVCERMNNRSPATTSTMPAAET